VGEMTESVWSGTFRIFGVDLKCHVLSDGRRIIEADSMADLMEAMEAPGGKELGDIEAFHRWKGGRNG
jgi:hypothetical protein